MDHSPLTLVRGKKRKGGDGARVRSVLTLGACQRAFNVVCCVCVPRRGQNRRAARAARSFDMIKRTHADFDMKIDSSW